MNDEGLADAAAANPFSLPRLHPGIGLCAAPSVRKCTAKSQSQLVTRHALAPKVMLRGPREGRPPPEVVHVACPHAPDGLARCGAPDLLLMSGSCGEELLDENCGVVRILFREEVATLDRLPSRVRSPLPPNAQWTAIFCIERVERATLGP
jgi:hypothetical protein